MLTSGSWRRILPRYLVPTTAISTLNMANDVATPAEDSPSSRENKLAIAFRRHPKYWLDDGSLVIRAQSDVFKVHRTLLDRHSTILSSLSNAARSRGAQVLIDGCPAIQIPDDLGVESVDFEALLEHLYHDMCGPLSCLFRFH